MLHHVKIGRFDNFRARANCILRQLYHSRFFLNLYRMIIRGMPGKSLWLQNWLLEKEEQLKKKRERFEFYKTEKNREKSGRTSQERAESECLETPILGGGRVKNLDEDIGKMRSRKKKISKAQNRKKRMGSSKRRWNDIVISKRAAGFQAVTSRRLSPTSVMKSLWPRRSMTRDAFSAANMDVKSNMATSGWP